MFVSQRVAIGWINWARHLPTRPQKPPSPLLIIRPRKPYQPIPPDIITKEPRLYNRRNGEKSTMSQLHINQNTNPSSDPNYFNNTHCFNTDNTVSYVWNNCTIPEEDSGILAWLSPLEPQTRHHDIRSHRVGKVGGWLLETEEYRNWLGGAGGDGPNGSALFCYGGPGVGKTYIR